MPPGIVRGKEKSMKELIPMNEFGMMADKDSVARVDSRMIAETFGKQHKDVLRAIKAITGEESGFSPDFTERNFALSRYTDSTGRSLPCYQITRDGFVALAMGFTGRRADEFKEAYINRFNEMEEHIRMLQSLRDQNPLLTEAIKATRENPKPYDYSNEADMINRIVLGMSAKQYREKHSIPKSEPIRPHLTAEEATLMEHLQMIDIGLQYSEPEYQKRKQTLEWYVMNWRAEKTVLAITDAAAITDAKEDTAA